MYSFSISQCFGLGKSKPDFQLIFHSLPGNGRSGVCPTLRDEVEALLNYRSKSWRIWKFLKEIRANYQGQESRRTMELHSTLKRSWKSCFYAKNWTGLSKWRYFFNFWLHGLGLLILKYVSFSTRYFPFGHTVGFPTMSILRAWSLENPRHPRHNSGSDNCQGVISAGGVWELRHSPRLL